MEIDRWMQEMPWTLLDPGLSNCDHYWIDWWHYEEKQIDCVIWAENMRMLRLGFIFKTACVTCVILSCVTHLMDYALKMGPSYLTAKICFSPRPQLKLEKRKDPISPLTVHYCSHGSLLNGVSFGSRVKCYSQSWHWPTYRNIWSVPFRGWWEFSDGFSCLAFYFLCIFVLFFRGSPVLP